MTPAPPGALQSAQKCSVLHLKWCFLLPRRPFSPSRPHLQSSVEIINMWRHNRVWVQEQGRRSLEWKHVLPAQFAEMIFEWPLKMLFEPQECLYMKGHRAFCWDKQQLYEGWCSKTEKSLQVNNILSGRQGAKPSSSDGWKQVDSQKDRFSELSDEFGWTSRPQSVSWFTRFKKSYCWRFPFNPQSCIQSLCLRLSFREPKKEGRHQTGFQTVLTKPNISTSYDFW